MKKTFCDKLISKNKKRIKKYPKFKLFFMSYQKLLISFYNLGLYFAHNFKRCTFLCMAFVLFLVNSSFMFQSNAIVLNEEANLSEQVKKVIKNTDLELTEENKVIELEDEYLDDEDVFDYELEDELEDTNEVDKYSLEDILEDTSILNDKKEQDSSDLDDTVCFDKEDWKLILINKQHAIPEDYKFPLGTIKNNMKCDERIIEDLLAMMQAAKEDGVTLIICSPYRDYHRQEIIFNRKINKYMSYGMSYVEAYKKASKTVTVPGASEHQIGLAIDFITNDYTKLNSGFGKTKAGIWLKEHSCEYGFILRYPLGKEYITGINYEPWHFRYVGYDAAMEITSKNITLEEFLEDL